MPDARPEPLEPFGTPDGARANLEEVVEGFVTFGSAHWGGLATRGDDVSARVIVGRKGSGKTVYLRRLQSHAAADASRYADSIQRSLPTTLDVVRFCQWFTTDKVDDAWTLLWSRAIL